MSQTRFALRNFKGEPVEFYRVETEVKDTSKSAPASSPSHHIFVFDVSGSMYHDLRDLKATVEKVLTLDEFNNPGLKVSLITYSSMGDVRVHFERTPIEDVMGVDSPQIREIRNLQVRGLTCISQGLSAAEKLISDGEITCISLHSDGYANDRSPSRENKAIQEAVGQLKAHPNVFVNTVAYRDWSDFNLLAGIANQLSGTCIQAKSIKQVYQAFYDTQQLLTGSMSPTIELDLGDADYGIFVSKSGRKVLGTTETINVCGLSASDDATVYRLFGITQEQYEAIEKDAPEDLALAYARAAISEGNFNVAKYALVSARDDDLLKAHYRALTATAVASMAEGVEQSLFNRLPGTSRRWDGNYGLSLEGPTALSVLQTIDEYRSHIRVHVPTMMENYKRRGIKRVAGVRNEDGTVTEPKYDVHPKNGKDGFVQVSAVEINRNTATANIRLVRDVNLVEKKTGTIIEKVAGIPLDLKDFRNYTLIGDGEVTTTKLPIQTSDKRAFRALKALGVVDGEFDPAAMLVIDMANLPLVDFSQEFDIQPSTFDKLAKFTVLSKILSGVLKSSSTSLTGDQIAELGQYHLTPSLYFSPPSTVPYTDLQEAIAKGEVDTRLSYRVEVGTAEITNLGKLASGNAYLQRRFTLVRGGDGSLQDDKREKVEKPTLDMWLGKNNIWGIKQLSSRTKLDAVDALAYPIYADFLGLEDNGHILDVLQEAGLDYDDRKAFMFAIREPVADRDQQVEVLAETLKRVDRAISDIYQQKVCPLVFYVGATGLLPESFTTSARTAEQISQDFPDIKLAKAEKEEGTFFPLGNGLLLTVYVTGEHFTVDRKAA